MKKIISLLLVLLLALTSAVAVNAEGIKDIFGGKNARGVGGTYGSLTWDITDGQFTLSPTGGGTAAMDDDYDPYDGPWSRYKSQITSVVIAEGVTSVGAHAFEECSNIASVSFPSTLTRIGSNAFRDCNNGGATVVIPNSVTSIGNYAFAGCEGWNITYPAGATLGEGAFDWGPTATPVSGGSDPTPSNPGGVYGGSLAWEIVDGVLTINYTGSGSRCLPSNGPWCDYGSEITSVVIGEGINDYDFWCFNGCNNVTTVTLPSTFTSSGLISDNFDNTNLTTIIVSPDNPSLSSQDGVLFNKTMTNLIYCPQGKTGNYTVPNGVTTINNYAFQKTSLTSITYPASVTSVGYSNPSYSSTLRTVTFMGTNTSIAWDSSYGQNYPYNVTICGYGQSTARDFALEHGYRFRALDDSSYDLDPVVPTYTIVFDANGGSNAPSSVTEYEGFDATLPMDEPTKSGKAFVGWATSASATEAAYQPGETYPANTGTVTLYAVWTYDGHSRAAGTTSSGYAWVLQDGVLTISDTTPESADSLTYTYGFYAESVNIGSGVTSLDIRSGFSSLANVRSLVVPSTVTSIGAGTFSNMVSLDTLYIMNENVAIGNGTTICDSHTAIFGYTGSTAETYATNKGLTFYPLDDNCTFTYTFDANGGTGGPTALSKTLLQNVQLPSTTPTRSGYTFVDWLVINALSPYTVNPGATMDVDKNLTLQARWICNDPLAVDTGSYVDPATGLICMAWDQKYNCGGFSPTELGTGGSIGGYSAAYVPEMSMNIDPVNRLPKALYNMYNKFVLLGGAKMTEYDLQETFMSPWLPGVRGAISYRNTFLTLDEEDGYYGFNSHTQDAHENAGIFEVSDNNGYDNGFWPLDEVLYNEHSVIPGYFGIKLAGEFVMPKDGKLQWNDRAGDMKYEFAGDDFIFVYIDGVKVLNGGSVEGHIPTSINFSTGEVVTVRDGEGSNNKPAQVTTIRDQFILAYKERTPNWTQAGLDAYLDDIFVQNSEGQYVFKDYSTHTFEMFYAETDNQKPTCVVKLNLPLDPKNNTVHYRLTYDSGEKTFTNDSLAHGAGEVTSKLHDDTYSYGDEDTVAYDTGVYEMNVGDSTFLGWGLDAEDDTVDYEPGDDIHIYRDTTLYAKFSDEPQSEHTNSLIYISDGTEYAVEDITGVTNYTLTAAPITSSNMVSGMASSVEDGLPIKNGYLFGGWYTSQAAATARTEASAYPQSMTLSNYRDSNGNVYLYAGWVPKGTVTVNSSDPNRSAYGKSTLSGFDLEGIQIKKIEIEDKYQPQEWENQPYNGLRFITVYRNGMLTELENLYTNASESLKVGYGYAMYAKFVDGGTITGKLKNTTDGAHKVDCTKEGDHNHQYFNDYRLSTVVVKYEQQAELSMLVEARAYVEYTDANAFARTGYDTYGDTTGETMFAGGCRARFTDAADALSRVQ